MTRAQKPKKKHIITKPLHLAVVGIVWQFLWIVSLAKFEIREQLIGAGVFGSNCGGCIEQTQISLLAIIIPLAIGSLLIAFSIASLLKLDNLIYKIIAVVVPAVIITIFSVYAFGLTNFIMNFAR